MSPIVIAMALSAAVMHAAWNAFLRTGTDRLWTVTVMSFSGTIIAIPFAAALPLPAAEAWLYIALSALLQVLYSIFLVAAYRSGELGQVYPIVRGTVPLLVTLAGFVLIDEKLGSAQLMGVLLVGAGIMSLAFGKGRADTKSLIYAFATGLIIATYARVDALGVRLAGNSGAYAAWVLISYGLLLPLAYIALRRRFVIDFRAATTWTALGGGIVAMISYGLVVTAFALGPAGPVSALRETSVVFAVLIGWLFLGETLNFRRVLACCVVAAGAICIGL